MLRKWRTQSRSGEGGAPEPQAAEWQADWRAPAELQRCTPRPVRLTTGGYAVAATIVLLIAGAVVLGVFLYTSGQRERARGVALAREGVTAEALVVRLGTTTGKDRRRFVIYQYEAAGRTYQGRTTLQRRDEKAFETGLSTTVRYLPGEPERSWLAGYGPAGPPTWVALVAPLSLLAPALGLALMVRRQRRLLEEGTPAQGRVASYKKFHTQHSSGYHVYYEFQVLSGATQKVRQDSSKKPPAPGTAVTILYDPDVPKRAAKYPLSLVRVDLE